MCKSETEVDITLDPSFLDICTFESNETLSSNKSGFTTIFIELFILSLKYFQQPTWRLWGEEKVDGGIYTVYLKKVRYNTPSRSVNDDQEDHISHLEWETVRVRFMKAGTLEKLVESLASDTGELESTYINVFLATYRTFASAKQVLNLLTER